MIKQTITTIINSVATSSHSLSEFRSKLKPEIAKLNTPFIRKDLLRAKLTKEMWQKYKQTNYINYPDKAVTIVMEEFMKARLCKLNI